MYPWYLHRRDLKRWNEPGAETTERANVARDQMLYERKA